MAEEENFGNSTFGQIRTWLWNVMEYPWTSKIAQVRLYKVRIGFKNEFSILVEDAFITNIFYSQLKMLT